MNYFLDIMSSSQDPVGFPSNPNGLANETTPNIRNKRYYQFIKGVLDENKDKNFVKRIFDPSMKIDLGGGEFATHMMAYDPKSKRVFPTVVQKGDSLVMLRGDEAYDYADKTGEFIKFDSAKEARKFAEGGYKIIWDNEDNPFIKKRK